MNNRYHWMYFSWLWNVEFINKFVYLFDDLHWFESLLCKFSVDEFWLIVFFVQFEIHTVLEFQIELSSSWVVTNLHACIDKDDCLLDLFFEYYTIFLYWREWIFVINS
jgi:hypothetical protein